MTGQRSGFALASALAVLCAALGCASSLDLERARAAIERGGPEPAPALRKEPNDALHAVGDVSATSGELRAIPLRWEASREREVAGYVVERAVAAEGPFVYVATVPDRFRTVYVDRGLDLAPKRVAGRAGGGLTHGETYYYRVRPFDGAGRIASAPSTVVSGTTAPKPAPPAGLQAYSHLPRRVALRWEPSADPHVTGYVVSRSPSASGTFAVLGRVEGRHQTVFVDARLPDLGVFYYRVASVDAAGAAGDPSGAERAVTKGEPLPPTGLRVAAQTIGENTLVWEPNVEPDLRGYQVLRRRAGAKETEIVAEVPATRTRATDAGVVAGEALSYRVVASDEDGLRSAPSDPVEIHALDYDVRATATAEGVLVRWNPTAQASFHEARILAGGDEVGRSTRPEFLHREGKAGTHYQVVGVREGGAEVPPSKSVEAE